MEGGGGDIHVGGCRGPRGEGEKRRIGGGEGTNNFWRNVNVKVFDR